MTFRAATAVVDIRKHKSRGDTIERHSDPYFIVRPTTSKILAGPHVLTRYSRARLNILITSTFRRPVHGIAALGLVALLATDNRIVEIPRAFPNVKIKTAP